MPRPCSLGTRTDITAPQTAGTTTNQVVFANNPTALLVGSAGNQILPFALVTQVTVGTDFATTVATNSIFNLIHFANYNTSANINSAAAGSIFKLTSATTNAEINANSTVSLNAILFSGTGLTLSGGVGSQLTLTGGIIGAATSSGGGSDTIQGVQVAADGRRCCPGQFRQHACPRRRRHHREPTA